MSDPANVDFICLKIIPREEMTKVMRLATTALANRAGLNLDQADDMNTALEEIFRFEISGDHTDELPLTICYNVCSDRLEVITEGTSLNLLDESDKVSRYSRFVIESVTDEFSESRNPDGGYNILMVKSVTR